MEPISKEQQLQQIQQALSVQGIGTTVSVLFHIELTQQKITEVGENFTLKDAVEIRTDILLEFPPEKFPQYYPQQ